MTKRKKWCTYQRTPHFKGRSYMIYNEGNNGRIIFRDNADKQRFLNKFKFYFDPFVKFEPYSLLPNHFHLKFTMRKKFKKYSDNRYVNLNKAIDRIQKLSKRQRESIIIGELMRRFFMSYAKYFNYKYNETGSLFRKNYKRVLLETDDEARRAIIFIHRNAQKHGLVKDFRNYSWSSYRHYIEQAKLLFKMNNLCDNLFDNLAAIELAHENHNDFDDQDIQIEY